MNYDPREEVSTNTHKVLHREIFYKGQEIISQGEKGIRAYFIEKGTVEIIVKDDQHELKISELGPGEVFGEMALINNEKRTATVRAMEDTSVIIISREELSLRIAKIKDEAVKSILLALVERLRDSNIGQLQQYKTLAEFQERVTGLVKSVDKGVSKDKKEQFRQEVMPILKDLSSILHRYQNEEG